MPRRCMCSWPPAPTLKRPLSGLSRGVQSIRLQQPVLSFRLETPLEVTPSSALQRAQNTDPRSPQDPFSDDRPCRPFARHRLSAAPPTKGTTRCTRTIRGSGCGSDNEPSKDGAIVCIYSHPKKHLFFDTNPSAALILAQSRC